MQLLIQNKGVLFGGLLFLSALFAYKTFFDGVAMPDPNAPSPEALGADLIKISDSISRATLSRELFSTTGYRLLSDWSTSLQPEPLGRVNPFAPIGQQ